MAHGTDELRTAIGAVVVTAGLVAAAASTGGTGAAAAVLAGIAVAALALRARRPRTGASPLERIASCALGHREAVHLVRVGDDTLVLGVTPASITLLATRPGRPAGDVPRTELDSDSRKEPARALQRAPRGAAARVGRTAGAVAVALLVAGVGLGAPAATTQGESTQQIDRPRAPGETAGEAPDAGAKGASPSPKPAHREPLVLPPPPASGTLVLIAGFAILPFLLMATTSFVKISIVLSLLRTAIGTPQAPSDPVLAGIAMALTLFVMAPVTQDVIARLEAGSDRIDTLAGALGAALVAGEPVRSFLQRNARPEEVALFVDLSTRDGAPAAESTSFAVLVPAFVTTELREAFVVGFLVFLPFLVVDLVVANILMSMGMVMVSPASVSLPFKILLFVLVDGWPLLMKGLALGYR